MNSAKPRTLFLSHGGGPLPLLGDPGHQEMVANLRLLAEKYLARPSAILIVSAHWEEPRPTVTGGAHPPLIYDYYGFPEKSYSIQYPCPGAPSLARAVHRALEAAGFDAVLDESRGFDHGLFVPLKIMYPEADIPCFQLSLLRNLDPAAHLRLGSALADVGDGNLLVVGSGFSFHNLREFLATDTRESRSRNESFEAWLIQTCTDPGLNEDERARRLEHWVEAPFARYCHPREEHLLPLHVCYGLARRPCAEHFELEIMRKRASVFLW